MTIVSEGMASRRHGGWLRTARTGFVTALTVLALATGASAQDKPFRIGSILPMTGGGAGAGASGIFGIEMAIEEINAAGGILGRKVELVKADDQGDPTHAVTAARRLMESEGVDAVIGPAFSGTALAVAGISTKNDKLYVSAASSVIVTPEAAPYHFSMQGLASGQGIAMVTHVADNMKGVKRVAGIVDSGANSKTILEAAKEEAKKRGLEFVGEDFYQPNTTDMAAQLLKLRGTNPDVLLVSGTTNTDTGQVLKNIAQLGWKVPVVGSNGIGGYSYGSLLKIVGDDEIFSRVAALDVRVTTYCQGDPVGSSDYSKMIDRLKKRVPPDQWEQVARIAASYFYAGTYVIKYAAEGAKSTSGKAMTEWLEANAGSMPSVLGKLSASKTSHFLMGGAEANNMVADLKTMREDGLRRKAGC